MWFYNNRILTKFACQTGRSVVRLQRLPNFSSSGDDNVIDISIAVGDARLKISSGRFARFADGCAVGQCGDTSALATAVSRMRPSTSSNFLPLTVDYRHKAAAAGRIPTNFLRRELVATDSEILISRTIDRSLRPLFPEGYFYDTQIICNLLAVDPGYSADVICINASSAALLLSDIPWNGPVGAVRIGIVDGELVVNPNRKQQKNSPLDMLVSGTADDRVVMIELTAQSLSSDIVYAALKMAVVEIGKIVKALTELASSRGKQKRLIEKYFVPQESLIEAAIALINDDVEGVLKDFSHDKISRDNALTKSRQSAIEQIKENRPDDDEFEISRAVHEAVKRIFRRLVLSSERRCDGRRLDELRPISCEVDLFKPLHGSALFQRGQSQVLSSVTFDSLESAFRSDAITSIITGFKEKNFMLHYEFPSYAVNEVGSHFNSRRFGRREIGHGALAERALRAVVPQSKEFDFTIRLTSEVLESNGSTSMASVCGGSLALMDAGVPIAAPVAGIAIGLISDGLNDNNNYQNYKILTDISGIEDYMGDMDFKVAGTANGITALQMDIKLPGVPVQILQGAFEAGQDGIRRVLQIMSRTLSAPRKSLKENGPVVKVIELTADQRGKFMGVGGYNIKKLESSIGVRFSTVDEQHFQLFAANKETMAEALEYIDKLLKERDEELKFNSVYLAKITKVRPRGVLVVLWDDMPPVLIPNSQLDQRKVDHPSVLGLKEDQEILVKYFGRDPVDGKIRLSRMTTLFSKPINLF